ncbi:MAG: DNA-directed RNA polymerase subunit beta [Pseudoclavibacter sp.]
MREHHRPVLFGDGEFERIEGAADPAAVYRLAHETARTLMARARGMDDENVLKRLSHYTDEHGVETITELWATASAESLPGMLWRIYLLRSLIMASTEEVTALYDLGARRLSTADPIVTGLDTPAQVLEVQRLSERILRGVFSGDFHLALMQAAAFCSVLAAGCLAHVDVIELTEPDAAARLTRQAGTLTDMVVVFRRGAVLWTQDALD